jgi:hypothetical protein
MTSSPPAKRACDACHRRKVRCIGGIGPSQACRNCSQASLQCTYNAIPQKKGPKGSRAKVISELRDTQQQTTIAQKLQDHQTSSVVGSPSSGGGFNGPPPLSPVYNKRDTSLLTKQTIDSCLSFYSEHMYSITPIFHQQRLQNLVATQSSTSPEVYCLAAVMCSFIMIQPGMVMPGTPGAQQDTNRYSNAELLLQEALHVRKSYDYVENPSLIAVQTEFFLFACYFSLEKQNAAWYHLIQATTLAQMTGMHEESSYLTGDKVENMYRRRTFWLILLTERAYAMERHRPLTLHPTIELPDPEEDPADRAIISGFLHLINLYRHIDDDFIGLWNKTKSECSTAWLAGLQRKLLDALPPKLTSTESQAADIYSTQHWLRTMVWQLSIMNGYLSSSSTDSCMTFQYPIEIARDLIRDITSLSQDSMEVHGVGLIEKLFDVACTLTDVIACVPLDTAIFGTIPADYLNQFLYLISRLRGGASRFVPLLLAKISENIPSLTGLHFMQSDYSDEPSPPGSDTASASSRNMQLAQSPASSQSGPRPPTDTHLMFGAYSPSASGNLSPSGTPQGMMPHVLAPIPRSIPRSMPFGQHG